MYRDKTATKRVVQKIVVFYQFISRIFLDFLGSFAERNCVRLVDKRLK